MTLRSKLGAGALGAALALASVLIGGAEGRRLHAYLDAHGIWTICDGHTAGVQPTDTATPAQCDGWRQQDMLIANAAIDRCIRYPLTSNQRAALISGVYNLGPALVCGSTLQALANHGDMRGACAQLPRWDHIGATVVKGLATRRQMETAVCWPDFSDVVAGVN